jgi:hypothetical protein
VSASKKASRRKSAASDLWVAPKSNFKNAIDERTWIDHSAAVSARLLELADIALGLRKPSPSRKRRSSMVGAATPLKH